MIKASGQENRTMALVRLLRGGQLTVPAEIRQKLQVKEGDLLEAEVMEQGIFLKPVQVVEREQARQDLRKVLTTAKWIGPGPEPTEDEVMESVVDEIHAMRSEDDKKGGSR